MILPHKKGQSVKQFLPGLEFFKLSWRHRVVRGMSPSSIVICFDILKESQLGLKALCEPPVPDMLSFKSMKEGTLQRRHPKLKCHRKNGHSLRG